MVGKKVLPTWSKIRKVVIYLLRKQSLTTVLTENLKPVRPYNIILFKDTQYHNYYHHKMERMETNNRYKLVKNTQITGRPVTGNNY